MRDDTDVVRRILEAALGEGGSIPGEGISRSIVIQSSNGHVYVGHDGYRDWLARASPVYREQRFVEDELRDLGGGFVLLSGIVYLRTFDDEVEAQPGAWLMHVTDGQLDSIVFFRTIDQALAAASADTPQTRRRALEQLIVAFNRDDYRGVLAAVASNYRFSTPIFPGVEFEGHYDAADVLEQLRERYPAYRIESFEITDLGGGYVALETVNRALRNGELRRARVTWLIRFERGLMRSTTHHPSLEAAVDAYRRAAEPERATAGAPPLHTADGS